MRCPDHRAKYFGDMIMRYMVKFYTDDDVLFAWYLAKTREEAQGLRRTIKRGYATVEEVYNEVSTDHIL